MEWAEQAKSRVLGTSKETEKEWSERTKTNQREEHEGKERGKLPVEKITSNVKKCLVR